jgi:hypothetical protein
MGYDVETSDPDVLPEEFRTWALVDSSDMTVPACVSAGWTCTIFGDLVR